ncbi:hypothetical protein NEOLI_002701 [Neolecta irregularis DAH-3]|uniref:Uncharacterized protein n=1 Tax=Neolecta irregularis (strain DAH-3) TaxID=1198029 RepID=A0A1U7LI15_NEOID|nr:hypothetical protein NEOLI_002701 [Neolecta irregularis DAH-3]|eukprot:OLL22300.1 hypothetical protein NEOLI_002701 [Neolecta irregularis DAH-3]
MLQNSLTKSVNDEATFCMLDKCTNGDFLILHLAKSAFENLTNTVGASQIYSSQEGPSLPPLPLYLDEDSDSDFGLKAMPQAPEQTRHDAFAVKTSTARAPGVTLIGPSLI